MMIFKHLMIFLVMLVIILLIWTASPQNSVTSKIALSTNSTYSALSFSTIEPTTNQLSYDNMPDDFRRLIDLKNFEFTINQPPCIAHDKIEKVTYEEPESNSEVPFSDEITESSGKPLLLILIHSAPVNNRRRMIIRKSWGSWTAQVYRVMFLIGAVESPDLQKTLEMENKMFKDLIQGNFIDTYRNLTYKHVMALKWYINYCPEAEFLMKTDDDIFVNTPFVVDYLNGLDGKSDLLLCHVYYHRFAQRKGKWRVSIQEYPETYYPDFCPGFTVIYSQNIAMRLYNEAQLAKYYWMDDVQITGILRQKANITLTNIEPFLLKKINCKAIRKGKLDISKILVSRHNAKADQIDCAWELVQRTLNSTR